jgi:adenine phosphoribosyltransferase
MAAYEKTRKSILESPVIDRDGYPYLVNPISDGVPRVKPELLNEVVKWMMSTGDFDCDVILAPESMGIPLVVPISITYDIPYSIVRKRKYGLPGETAISQVTGYSKSEMYINGVNRGDSVVIIDDVLSTGGTIKAIVNALRDVIGANIVDILIVYDKGENKTQIELDLGLEIKTMFTIGMVKKKPVILRVG